MIGVKLDGRQRLQFEQSAPDSDDPPLKNETHSCLRVPNTKGTEHEVLLALHQEIVRLCALSIGSRDREGETTHNRLQSDIEETFAPLVPCSGEDCCLELVFLLLEVQAAVPCFPSGR